MQRLFQQWSVINLAPKRKKLQLSDKDLYWLAGLCEGEASFMTQKSRTGQLIPRFAINMVDEDVIARVAEILNVKYQLRKPAQEGWQVQYTINVATRWVADLMELLLPLMGNRRSAQIQKVLDCVERFYPGVCQICEGPIFRPTDSTTKPHKVICSDECARIRDRQKWKRYRQRHDTPEKREETQRRAREDRRENPERYRQYRESALQRKRDAQPDFYDDPCTICGEWIPRPKDRITKPKRKFCGDDCKTVSHRKKGRESHRRRKEEKDAQESKQ